MTLWGSYMLEVVWILSIGASKAPNEGGISPMKDIAG